MVRWRCPEAGRDNASGKKMQAEALTAKGGLKPALVIPNIEMDH